MSKDGAYFTGDRDFWDDGDFKTSDEQLVYAMLWQSHGTDIAGIRQRNDRLDAARVHMTLKRFQHTLSILYAGGKVGVFESRIWIKSAIWHNLAKGKCSPTQLEAVKIRLNSCGSMAMTKEIVLYYQQKYAFEIPYAYPMHTLPMGCPSGLDWTGSGSGVETGSGSGVETETLSSPNSVSSDARELAEFLKIRILENKPDRKLGSNWSSKTTAAIDKMIRLDHRDPKMIRVIIEWCQADNEPRGSGKFCWAPNILSGEKLRKQFDRLEDELRSRGDIDNENVPTEAELREKWECMEAREKAEREAAEAEQETASD